MNRSLRRLDSIHLKLMNAIAPLDDSLFARSPSNNEWSIAQIVHHLCLVEQAVTSELEKGLARPPQQVGFLRRLIPTSIVAIRLVRVKAPRAMNPLDPPAKEEVIANYNAARDRLKELCASHGGNRLKQVVFKHPFLGDINGLATISFVGYHELRHYKQLRETLTKLSAG
jgi:DinB family protein